MSSHSLNYDELPFSEEDRPPQSAKRESSNTTEGKGTPTNPSNHRHGIDGHHVARDPARSSRSARAEGRSESSWQNNAEKLVHDDPLSAAEAGSVIPDVRRIGVSSPLREAFLRQHEAIRHHVGHRTMMAYILLTSFRGKNGRPVLDCENVVACYGCEDRRGERVSAKRLLELFRDEVLPGFKWTGYKPKEGCREALHVPIKDLRDRLDKEMQMRPSELDGYCNFVSGRKIDGKYITNVRKGALKEVKDMDEPCEESKRWASYMNSRPADLYARDAQKNIAEAFGAVEDLPEGSQRGAFRHLRTLERDPKPIYRYNDTTPRITAKNSLQTINSDLRHVLVGDEWTTYDLSSAQLAIVAVDWGADEIAEFLRSDGDVWEYICEETGLPFEYKPVMKKALYSTAYGANPENILTEHMDDRAEEKGLEYRASDHGRRIMEVPLLSKLIDAREEEWERIEANGGATDCFGRFLSLRKLQEEHGKTQSGAVRTVLSTCAQAKEMDLLSPALDLALEQEENARPSFQIALYEYDGFSVKYHRSQKHHHERIMDAVNRKCRREGYPTRLEVEE